MSLPVILFVRACPPTAHWLLACDQLELSGVWQRLTGRCEERTAPHPGVVLVLSDAALEGARQLGHIARLQQVPLIVFNESPSWEQQIAWGMQGGILVRQPDEPERFLRAARPWLKAAPRTAAAAETPEIRVHRGLRSLHLEGTQYPLQPRELELIELLAQRDREWLQTGELCRDLFGEYSPQKRRLLWQHMHNLRKKLGRWGGFVQFSRGLGYRCAVPIRLLEGPPEPLSEPTGPHHKRTLGRPSRR